MADETGELVRLIVEEHGRGVYLERARDERAVHTSGRIGLRAYLYVLAAGKCILAHLPPSRVEEITDRHGLPAQTDESITDPDDLFEELETVRARGIAYNDGEEVRGVRAIGAPTLAPEGVVGGISVASPMTRVGGIRGSADKLSTRGRQYYGTPRGIRITGVVEILSQR